MDIQTAIKDEKFLKRFWSKVTKTQDGCWLWTGSLQTQGYGNIEIKGKRLLPHRIAYILHKGEIPQGLSVCHHCDIPKCCNPEHLFLGTAADNTNDATQKGRMSYQQGTWDVGSVHRDLTHCKRGHLFDEKNTGKQANGRYCKRCEADRKQRERAGKRA